MTDNTKPTAAERTREALRALNSRLPAREDIVINGSMLGAPGVGKTSLLASMYERFGDVIGSVDLDMLPESETSRTLGRCLATLKKLPTSVKVTAALPGTGSVRHYQFAIGAKGTTSAFTLRLTDYPGKYMLPGHYADREKVEYALATSDVIIVSIDTPALVEMDGRFHDVVNTPTVVTDEIKRLLADTTEPRLLILTLLKCETYLESAASTEKLVNLVKARYQPLLNHIAGVGISDRVGCVLASVQTIGSIRLYEVDTDSVGDPVFRFRATRVGASYAPVDTDQPLRYLLRFVINKYRSNDRPIWRSLWERINGVDGRLVRAVDNFAAGCKTTDGFEILQDHPLLHPPVAYRSKSPR
jgi:hypothetical protein